MFPHIFRNIFFAHSFTTHSYKSWSYFILSYFHDFFQSFWPFLSYYGTHIVTTTIFSSTTASSYWSKEKHSSTLTRVSLRQKSRPRIFGFHRKYLILSSYMYSAWFYSLYVYSAVHNIQKIYTPDRNAFLNNPVHNLNVLEHTDEDTVPLVSRTPLQNKIILDALMAYQAPRRRHKNVHFDSDSFDICVDTGASSTCTSSRDDFVPGSYVNLEGATINGIASGLTVAGYGTVRWVFHDDNHQPIDVEIDKVLHIPDVPTRLLSPQQLAKQTGGLHDGFHVGASHATLTFGGFKRRINYNSVNNLPIFASFPGVDKFRAGTASDNLTFNQRQ